MRFCSILVFALCALAWPTLGRSATTLERAEQALADGDFARAADLADGVSGPEAARVRGEALEASGDLKGAAKAYAEAAEGAKAGSWLAKRAKALGAAADKAAAAPKPTARPSKAATSVATATALPTPSPTPQATQAQTMETTPVATAVPTLVPTEVLAPVATAAPTPDSSIERERAALEKERKALEDERIALKKKRLAAEAGYDDDKSDLPQGGLTLIAGPREQGYTSRFSSTYGMPMDVGLLFHGGGFNFGVGSYFAGADLDKKPTSGSTPCPTCSNSVSKDSVEITAPWVALGYDIAPWKAGLGQVRPFVPLGGRFALNYVLVNGETYVAPSGSVFAGLGARWRISRLMGLELSGRYNFHVAGDTIETENGKSLKEMNGDVIKPDSSGAEFRLGVQFFVW